MVIVLILFKCIVVQRPNDKTQVYKRRNHNGLKLIIILLKMSVLSINISSAMISICSLHRKDLFFVLLFLINLLSGICPSAVI